VKLLANLLWLVLGGLAIFAEYLIAALVLAISIIGLPFAIQCLKLATLALWPFGKAVSPGKAGVTSTIFNVLWLLTGGLILALTHLFFALLCAVTIIGLPFAKQHTKLASLALTPFGREIS
jgi:uncharacterized membrane protein YccF (DUF307 family)